MTSPTPIQPQQRAMLGSTPGESALIQQQQNNENHAALVNATKGGLRRRRKSFRGGMTDSERASISGQMVIPIVKPIYVDQGAGNQTVNSISTNLQAISTQNQANAAYDDNIGKTGGGKRNTRKHKTKRRGLKSYRKKRSNKTRKSKTAKFGKRR